MFTSKMAPSGLLIRILIGVTLVIATTAGGCATWDDRDPRPPKLSLPEFSDGGCQKRVALASFDNRTQLRFEEIEQSFFIPLNNQVKEECDDTLWITPYDPDFPGALVDAAVVTQKGVLDNMAIAQTGRQLGLGAVATGRIANISGFEREKGFWLFKGTHHYQRIMVQVDLYATETGAKILSEAYSREIEISGDEFKALAVGTVENSPAVMEAFQDLSEEIAENICETLDDTRWIGFVTSVDGNTVSLSSGAEVGLEPGSKLALYNSNRVFKTPVGNRFFVPGTQTGVVEITTVEPNSARATLMPDSKAEPGYVVRFR